MNLPVIPGRGRKPTSPESIGTVLSMTHRGRTHQIVAFMDSRLATSSRPGMTCRGG